MKGLPLRLLVVDREKVVPLGLQRRWKEERKVYQPASNGSSKYAI